MADVPIGFYYTAVFVSFLLIPRCPHLGARLMLLAGLFSGLAAWTKREGLPFIVCAIISRLLFCRERAKPSAGVKAMIPFVAGTLPGVLALVVLQVVLCAENPVHLDEMPSLFWVVPSLDLSRLVRAVGLMVWRVCLYGGWILPAFVVFLLLSGTRTEGCFRLEVRSSLATLLMMYVAYLAYYLLSSHNVEWHVLTTASRLFGQMWPSLVFLGMMAVRDEESVDAKNLEGDGPIGGMHDRCPLISTEET
jgi:hypothetical protein